MNRRDFLKGLGALAITPAAIKAAWPTWTESERAQVEHMLLPSQEEIAGDAALMMAEMGMTPDPWQIDLFDSDAQRTILLCCRQSGKSTSAATLALQEAIGKENGLVLLLSPSLRQSQELFIKVTDIIAAIGMPVRMVSALRVQLQNGSRIIALPGKEQTVRGYSGVTLLVIDEASRVQDDLYKSVRPMLAVSGGRLLLLSTPFGKGGFFYTEWAEGSDWKRIKITADQCPRITEEFLASERRSLGSLWYTQEYECNPPEAPIWMSDFSFQPIGEVRVGDTVIGWHVPQAE